MTRPLPTLVFIMAALAATSLSGTEPRASAPVLFPAGETAPLDTVKIPAGYTASLFATPPDVSYPTFVKPTPDGRVFVAIDKNSSLDAQTGRGSVVLCFDDDQDGKADRFTKFIADVDAPRGMDFDGEWLYLMHPPHLTAYRDTDGDNIADESRTLVKNIAFALEERTADHTSNGVTLGIDGYLYLAIGDFGFMEATGTDGKTAQLRGGGIVRVRTDGSDLEIFSRGTRNIYEAAVTPHLDAFSRDNTNDGGGWDVRLHHFTGLEDHGYPSLFLNFEKEIIQPLRIYGGGSGTGSHYLYEPGFPHNDGDALYTVDWGRSGIFQHPLERDGGTLREIGQYPFFEIDRATDLDGDAQGKLYVSSWSGGKYRYTGDDVGYILQILPPDFRTSRVPDFASLGLDRLQHLIARPSSSLQIAAQREILRRRPSELKILADLLADRGQTPEARIAALFTLQQAFGMASTSLISQYVTDPAIASLAIRALGDPDLAPQVDPTLFIESLRSHNARSRLEAAVALSRTEKPELTRHLLLLAKDEDPIVAHTAIKAAIELRNTQATLDALEDPEVDDSIVFKVLQQIPDEEMIDTLIAKLSANIPASQRRGIFDTLARLAVIEGKWTGESWGTRPDTTGPYYQRAEWSASPKIIRSLETALDSPKTDRAALIAAMAINQLITKERLPLVRELAEADPSLEFAYMDALLKQEQTPGEAIPLLKRIALSTDRSGDLRIYATEALARTDDPSAIALAFDIFVQPGKGKDFYAREIVVGKAINTFLDNPHKSFIAPHLLAALQPSDTRAAAIAWAALLKIQGDPNIEDTTRRIIGERVATALDNTASADDLFSAISKYKIWTASAIVIKGTQSPQKEISESARAVAQQLKINLSPEALTAKRVSDLPFEEAIAEMMKVEGDPALGETLFSRQTCIVCHTVLPEQTLKGPYLGNITSIYRRADLAKAILVPNESLAQGFITHSIKTKEGMTFTGFVSHEAADRVEIRDMTGKSYQIPTADIETRQEIPVSMMPPGLVSNLSIHDFASLIAYLEKVGDGH